MVISDSFPPRSKKVRRPDRPPLLGINVQDPGLTRSTYRLGGQWKTGIKYIRYLNDLYVLCLHSSFLPTASCRIHSLAREAERDISKLQKICLPNTEIFFQGFCLIPNNILLFDNRAAECYCKYLEKNGFQLFSQYAMQLRKGSKIQLNRSGTIICPLSIIFFDIS